MGEEIQMIKIAKNIVAFMVIVAFVSIIAVAALGVFSAVG
jgi:hypothetical protein